MAKTYTIREAARKFGLSEQYVRKMIHAGKIPTTMEPVNDYQSRHVIAEADLNAWRKRAKNRTSRDDGRNKFVAYLTKSEESRLRKLLVENQLTAVDKLLVRANPPTRK
jgi:transposase-like protein